MLRLEARGRDLSGLVAGALGPVLNRQRHSNGNTHVVDCDDVFSDAGSTPAASTKKPDRWSGFFMEAAKFCMQTAPLARLSSTNTRRLHHYLTDCVEDLL